jgi:hypothetical protein
MANARLAPDFHQNHATPPLAVFCSAPFHAEFGALFPPVWFYIASFQAIAKYSRSSNTI